MKKKLLVMTFVLLQCMYAYSKVNMDGNDVLTSIEGTYYELFTENAALNPKYDSYWINTCSSMTTMDNGAEIAGALKTWVAGTLVGEDAVKKYKGKDMFSFNTSFRNGITEITIEGNKITGKDKDGNVLFSNEYDFVKYDKNIEGNIYESKNENADIFRYFVFLTGYPAKSPCIEFRYGDDVKELKEDRKGKYAYWMAGGVKSGDEQNIIESIQLFCKNKLTF